MVLFSVAELDEIILNIWPIRIYDVNEGLLEHGRTMLVIHFFEELTPTVLLLRQRSMPPSAYFSSWLPFLSA